MDITDLKVTLTDGQEISEIRVFIWKSDGKRFQNIEFWVTEL